ncbi:MAG: CBS domain-containing protein [SAR324 cluster bacterium]|uniref:CBS domain-containing protein n=1 Tax=SAR324 cluster bacterium TaxID=2024889 RepID=A0A7X9FR92_9DELT|nr:CBS domain-containing protein [SAR324 cluster bacterium]
MTNVRKIKEFMVEHPYTIQYFEPLGVAEKLLQQHRIRHLPVLDHKKVYGMISDRDISLAASVYKGKDYQLKVFVKDICLSDPYVVDESAKFLDVLNNMSRKRLESVIVTKDKDVIGIFTMTDACRVLAELLSN